MVLGRSVKTISYFYVISYSLTLPLFHSCFFFCGFQAKANIPKTKLSMSKSETERQRALHGKSFLSSKDGHVIRW